MEKESFIVLATFNKTIKISLFCFLTVLSLPTHAELIMSAPPRETADQGYQIYGPLADLFSIILNEKVTYEHSDNWMNYQKQIREGRYDIVFDGPHFISWRMKHNNHIPLVKLPGNLEFFLVSHKNSAEIKTADDLVARKICGMPPPNLATMAIRAVYKNPMQQPIIIGVSGSYDQVYRDFRADKCDAMILRSGFYQNNLSEEQRADLKVIYRSEKMPNQGISVNRLKINGPAREKLIKALTGEDGKDAGMRLLNRFSKSEPQFLVARPEEYAKYYTLMEDQLFGW